LLPALSLLSSEPQDTDASPAHAPPPAARAEVVAKVQVLIEKGKSNLQVRVKR